jgi:NhaA family Na+:H+ antiporter
MPLFAFANSGLALSSMAPADVLHSVPLGIAIGLFIGKQLGIFSFCWLASGLGIARLPDGLDWVHIYGAALLGGVGFTMSLFIGSLAFGEAQVNVLFDERVGILVGSTLSGTFGFLVLWLKLRTGGSEVG